MDGNWEKLKKTNEKPLGCAKCGGPIRYAGRGAYECEKCGFTTYDDFGKVDQFLTQNGPSPAPVIARGTGLSIARVRELIEQGRLEAIPGSTGLIDSETEPKKSESHIRGGFTKAKEESGRIRFDNRR